MTGKLQNLEIKGSKELTDYNAAKQLEMWKATNYPAQVEFDLVSSALSAEPMDSALIA